MQCTALHCIANARLCYHFTVLSALKPRSTLMESYRLSFIEMSTISIFVLDVTMLDVTNYSISPLSKCYSSVYKNGNSDLSH